MTEIEVYTGRYEREHGQKPVGRGFWRFTLVSSKSTVADHPIVLQHAMTYQKALEEAQRVAELRKHIERIIVEP
jgi:hypothetical protein